MFLIFRTNILGVTLLLSILSTQAFAISRIDSLKEALTVTTNREEEVKIYTQLAKSYIQVNNDSANLFAYSALKFSDSRTPPIILQDIYGVIGDVAVVHDSLDKAKQAYLQAEKYCLEAKAWDPLIPTYMVLGNISLVQDHLVEALDYYHKGIESSQKYNVRTGMLPQFYLNIGTIYHEAKSYDDALKHFKLALTDFEKTHDSTDLAIAIGNIGSTYSEMNQLDTAEKYMRRNVEIFSSLHDHANLADAYLNLGALLAKKGDDTTALFYLQRYLDGYDSIGEEYRGPRRISLASAYLKLGSIYLKKHHFERASSYLHQGFTIAKENNQLSLMADASKDLSSLWEQQGNNDSALFYSRLYNKYYDEKLNEDNRRALAYKTAGFEFEQKQRAAELQQLKEESERRRINFILAVVIASLAVVSAVLYSLFKLGQTRLKEASLEKKTLEVEKKTLQNELEFRNKELTTHVMYQVKNKEFILKISEKLKNASLADNPTYTKMLREIISEIEMDSNTDSWKEFEIRFQNVYTSFYKNLSAKFPDISPNELRTCAFLKLNLATKDIAAITYQTTNSIDVARHRLRQKFGLGKEENLIAFLSQF